MSQQESKCPVNVTRTKLHAFYYSDDPKTMMCSKCHPCKLGIYDAIKILEAIQAGKGEAAHLPLLRRIARDVKGGSMCKKGKDHADILAAFLDASGAELEAHIRGYCGSHECEQLVTYMIDSSRCTMCDKCREVCPSFAVEGQKAEAYRTGYTPYRIRQKRCTHCGKCLPVCPEGAVFIVEDPGPDAEAEKKPERHAVGTCPV